MICQRWRSPSAADHQCRIRGAVKQRVTYSTDNSGDVTRRVTAHDGSWTDVHLAITIHPPARTTIQLAVGNLAQTPTPDSERQYRCIAQSRLSEAVLEYRVVPGESSTTTATQPVSDAGASWSVRMMATGQWALWASAAAVEPTNT
jgi:hypothetical protein